MKDYTNQNSLDKNSLIKEEFENLRIYKKMKKNTEKCGIVDSINFCLENRTHENDELLKLLVHSFEIN